MLNATEINSLIPKDGSIILMITRTKDGQLSVVVDPKYPKTADSDALKEALSPKTVIGSPEKLDAGFMPYLTQTLTSANSLVEAAEKIDQETRSALDKIKAESSKKIADAKGKTKTAASPTKSTGKSPTSPTQALLGDSGGEEEEADEKEVAKRETKKEEVKPEETVAVSLF